MDDIKVVLYSTGCPKCQMLKHHLDTKGIKYHIIDDIDVMLSRGFETVPMLSVDETVYNYDQALAWVQNVQNI